MRLVILGLGYSASRFAVLHRDRFETIVGTTRSKTASADAPGVEMVSFDGLAASDRLRQAVRGATHILISIAPDDQGDPGLRTLDRDIAAAPALEWIGYLSTVGVYGDFGGGWVDEAAPVRPTAPRGIRRVAAERAWLDLGARIGRPVQLFRLAGIYGPGRSPLDNLRAGTAHRIIKPGQVFNRIHVDDIAGAVMAGIARPDGGPVVNVADNEPAPPQDVVAYAAGLLGIAPPPEQAFETAELTPMARSFYGDNRRVSNARLREAFGYALRYPTYREGLRACLAAGLHTLS